MQWRVVILCFLLAVIDGFDAQIISYVAPLLVEEFSISPTSMGRLLSAALVGLMIGAFVGSPVADRVGRKPVIIISTVAMGVFTLLTANADSTAELFVYRFLTGLGLGGVMPNINTLTAEFSPKRRRAVLMTAMFIGFPIGTIVGGIISAQLLAQHGWPSVFLVGGILPIIMIPVLIFWLPESPRFLAARDGKSPVLADLVARMFPTAMADGDTTYTVKAAEAQPGVGALFANGRAPMTFMIWVAYFANLLAMYGMVGWLPSVLEAAGFPLERAILAAVLFSIGGIVGGLLIAATIDNRDAKSTMVASFLAAAVAIAAVGQATDSIPLLLCLLFLAGATAMGCQFGLNAFVSNSYDTHSRATGLGWALAVGRIGAIIGPIVVGSAISTALPISTLFLVGAIPMLVAAAAVFFAGRLAPGG